MLGSVFVNNDVFVFFKFGLDFGCGFVVEVDFDFVFFDMVGRFLDLYEIGVIIFGYGGGWYG